MKPISNVDDELLRPKSAENDGDLDDILEIFGEDTGDKALSHLL